MHPPCARTLVLSHWAASAARRRVWVCGSARHAGSTPGHGQQARQRWPRLCHHSWVWHGAGCPSTRCTCCCHPHDPHHPRQRSRPHGQASELGQYLLQQLLSWLARQLQALQGYCAAKHLALVVLLGCGPLQEQCLSACSWLAGSCLYCSVVIMKIQQYVSLSFAGN